MNIGDCYCTEIVGGKRYYKIVSQRGSGMYRADELTVTKNRATIEMDTPIMDWYFRTYHQINPVEYQQVLQDIIWMLEMAKSGEKRNATQTEKMD